MLPPVAAISGPSPIAPPREVAVVAEAMGGLAAEPDGAVALALAVSSGVEGKLNMLLINARERMLDSLFAVIDAVSQSLVLPQDAGESNASYALRLADTVVNLPAKQTAALQQQLTAQGQTAPLSLVAAALRDPTSTQAAQLIAYLEVVRYKDRDLATKSVLASYGQNDGSTKPETAAAALPTRTIQGQATTAANLTAVPQRSLPAATVPATNAGSASTTALPTDAAKPSVPASTVETAPKYPAGPSPTTQENYPSVSPAQPLVKPAAAAPTQPLQAASPNVGAAGASEVPGVPGSTPDETTPRVILQIRSDIQDGLKAVFDQLVQATGTELLQTMAEAEPLADKIIAQALIADMIDGTELNNLQMPDGGNAAATANAAAAKPLAAIVVNETDAQPGAINQLPADAPESAQTMAQQQAPVVPPGLAVGFVTTPYAPFEDVVKNKDPSRIDRVDAVDDEEHEGPGHQKQDAEPEDEQETSAEEALEMLEAEPDAASKPAQEPPASRSSMIALPRPTAEPLPNPGYNLYEHMGA